MVGMTRAHIADPHVVRKLREGRADDIRRCIGCMQACLEALANGLPIGCVYNPVTGREGEWATLEPAPRPRRVVVVGGGPAGLEAARVAALRGHRVVLLEASARLGGQLHLAARLPKRENFLEIVSFLSRQTAKLGVEVRLGCRADVDTVRAERPDTVVVATGSRPAMPDGLSGAPGSLVHVANVVSGEARVGDRVLVVDQDGHLRGSGVADLLAGQGRRVSIVSEQLYVGQGIDLKTLYPLQRRLREQGVEMLPSTRFVGWDAGAPWSPTSSPAPSGRWPTSIRWSGPRRAAWSPTSSSRSAPQGFRCTPSATASRPGESSTRSTKPTRSPAGSRGPAVPGTARRLRRRPRTTPPEHPARSLRSRAIASTGRGRTAR